MNPIDENIAYRDALIKALQTVKDRSAFCAPKINSILHPNYKKLAQLLVGTDGFSDKAKILKGMIQASITAQGQLSSCKQAYMPQNDSRVSKTSMVR